jgi:hypothetical protein
MSQESGAVSQHRKDDFDGKGKTGDQKVIKQD